MGLYTWAHIYTNTVQPWQLLQADHHLADWLKRPSRGVIFSVSGSIPSQPVRQILSPLHSSSPASSNLLSLSSKSLSSGSQHADCHVRLWWRCPWGWQQQTQQWHSLIGRRSHGKGSLTCDTRCYDR